MLTLRASKGVAVLYRLEHLEKLKSMKGTIVYPSSLSCSLSIPLSLLLFRAPVLSHSLTSNAIMTEL